MDVKDVSSPALTLAAQSAGQMARMMQEVDWSATPLGPMEAWPQSLRVAVGICLNSRFPMFVWWGPEMINIYNDAYIPVLGKRHPEALGRPAPEIWREIWDVVGPQAEAVMQRGEATWNERVKLVMQRHGYSEPTWFTWSYSPIPDDNGGIGGLFCACTEETGRVLAEAERDRLMVQLDARRSRLTDVFERSPAFMAILRGPEHVFELANERYYQMIGRRDVVGKPAREALPEVEGQGFFELLDRVYTTGEPYVGRNMPLRVRREAGAAPEERQVEFVYQPIREADGSVCGILVHGIDLTEHARAEAALRQSQRRLQMLFDNAQDSILLTNDEARYVDANPAACALTGYEREELLERSVWDITPPPDRQAGDRMWREFLASGRQGGEYGLTRKDGETVAVEFRAVANILPGLHLSVLRDVTERRRAEELLKSQNRALELVAADAPLQEVLEWLARIVEEQSSHQAVSCILLATEDGGRLRVAAAPNLPEQFIGALEGMPVASECCTCCQAALRNDVVISPDIAADDSWKGFSHLPLELGLAACWAVPIRGPDGEALGTFTTFLREPRPPTERERQIVEGLARAAALAIGRRRALASERELAEQRRLALDAARMGWWHLDPASGDVYYDERTARIYGLSGDRLGYAEIIERVHPEDRLRVQAVIDAATRAHESAGYEVEFRVVHPDGAVRWIRSQGQAYYEGQGQQPSYTSFVGTVADITDARAAADALRQSEARFRQLADAMPQIVWAAEPDGTIDYYNLRFYDYINQPERAAETVDWAVHVHPEDLEGVQRAYGQALASGRPYVAEFRIRGGEGAYRWFLARAMPIRNTGGAIIRWYGTCTDIDDQKRLQAENEQLLQRERAARSEAETANRAKDRFLAVLSHELRTPLTPVAMVATAMEMDPRLPYELREDVAMVRRNIELETRLIDDLLDLSRVISGKLRLNARPVHMHDVVRHVLETVGPELHEKRLAIQSELDAENDAVHADAARLQQTLWNLLKNSAKFTPAGGTIAIATRNEEDRLVIEVQDTGRGIDPQVLPHIFEPFEQGSGNVTSQYGGMGLGLAIARAVVDLHGGTIRARSEGEGRGATFIVSLPLSEGQPSEPSRQGEGPSEGQRHPVRLLLVEDHADTARTLVRLLRLEGLEVQWAGTVAEALRLAGAERFDLVVSDLGLPDGSGHDLMRELRSQRPTLGIATSGYGMEEDIRKSREAGFSEHLVKPVSLPQLREAIHRVAIANPRR